MSMANCCARMAEQDGKNPEGSDGAAEPKQRFVQSVLCGPIGFFCGLVGAGGGMILLLLTLVQGDEIQTAAGMRCSLPTRPLSVTPSHRTAWQSENPDPAQSYSLRFSASP